MEGQVGAGEGGLVVQRQAEEHREGHACVEDDVSSERVEGREAAEEGLMRGLQLREREEGEGRGGGT